MNKFPCATGIDCECTNYPVSNVSAEGPERAFGDPSDRPTFVCNWQHFLLPPLSPGPPPANSWCFKIGTSFISIESACVDAKRDAIICVNDNKPLVGNDEMSITVPCP